MQNELKDNELYIGIGIILGIDTRGSFESREKGDSRRYAVVMVLLTSEIKLYFHVGVKGGDHRHFLGYNRSARGDGYDLQSGGSSTDIKLVSGAWN